MVKDDGDASLHSDLAIFFFNRSQDIGYQCCALGSDN